MTCATARRYRPTEPRDQAMQAVTDARKALDRGSLKDALVAIERGRRVVEIQLQFEDARKART